MLEFFKVWYQRYFSDPQAVILVVFLVFSFTVIFFIGKLLAPVFAAVVIAYLLEGLVQKLGHMNIPRIVGVSIVFIIFLAVLLFMVVALIPLLSHQITDFIQELPTLINNGHQLLMQLPETYPSFITVDQVEEFISGIRSALTVLGQSILSFSIATIPTIVMTVVYVILGPLLVFFFLKDKDKIINWLKGFLPQDHTLLSQIWYEMDNQIGNYVRGKFNEVLIVGIATFIGFALMGMHYSLLLSVLNGLSVVVPLVGTTVVTIPVLFAAYAQWGWHPDVLWILVIYFVIHGIDGNVIVPILFSEAVDLHPVAIIVAVLVFGGLWGFWGVFFAIPLAILVRALLTIWPRTIEQG